MVICALWKIGITLYIILVVFLIRRKRKDNYLNKLKEEYVLGNVTEEEYLRKKEILKAK